MRFVCFRAGITFASVHDCYLTHAADVDAMNEICRDQFVSLHKQPILQNFSKHLVQNYGASEQWLKTKIVSFFTCFCFRELAEKPKFENYKAFLDKVLRTVPTTGKNL